MAVAKSKLKAQLRKATRRVDRENDVINRARDRRYYWQKVQRELETRLDLANSGQLEFPGVNNEGELCK